MKSICIMLVIVCLLSAVFCNPAGGSTDLSETLEKRLAELRNNPRLTKFYDEFNQRYQQIKKDYDRDIVTDTHGSATVDFKLKGMGLLLEIYEKASQAF